MCRFNGWIGGVWETLTQVGIREQGAIGAAYRGRGTSRFDSCPIHSYV